MSVFLTDQGVAYYSIPKCACSTIKSFFFEIENGFAFKPFVTNGRANKIHAYYTACKAIENQNQTPEGAFVFAVMRDPLSRILSLWRDKVETGRVLAEGRIKLGPEDFAAGISYDPDPDRFFTFLDRYRQVSSPIKRHSNSFVFHLGIDPAYFDRIYNISDLEQMRADLADRMGDLPQIKHTNKTKKTVSLDDVGEKAKDVIRTQYKRDYKIYADWI